MKRKKIMIAMLTGMALATSVSGCGTQGTDTRSGEDETDIQKKEAFVPELIGLYEAEEATFLGNVSAGDTRSGYSGSGYATGFANDGDACTFSVEIETAGFYDLEFAVASSDYKENFVSVDKEQIGTIPSDQKEFTEATLTRVYLAEGKHEISVSKYWGYVDLDCLSILTSEPIDASFYQVDASLINSNATDNTKRLMSYLADNYGSKILSGQYSPDGMYGKEYQVVNSVTGQTPAVLGLDFIEYSPSRVANGSSSHATDLAIAYWNTGGIVTFCWHWNAPEKYLTGEWYSGFRTEKTNINLEKIMNGEDEEGYNLLMEDVDAIAKELLKLQDAGVPILWRPLHEASGGWFWWGASGPEAYKKLYILLYDKLTNEYGLNNLIWLWNGQDKDWYPGDEYVDIIGEDLYPGEQVYSSQINKYLEAAAYTDAKKMVVMSENGCVFDPALAARDGAMWGMWCTWGQEFVARDSNINSYSDQYTDRDKLKEFYENDVVISKEDLPDLLNYPIREELN